MKEGIFYAQVWQYVKGSARLFLLDFDLEENDGVKERHCSFSLSKRI